MFVLDIIAISAAGTITEVRYTKSIMHLEHSEVELWNLEQLFGIVGTNV